MDQEEREIERERESVYINIYKTFTTRLGACLAEPDYPTPHTHAHTHTDRHTDRHRNNAGEVEPLQGTRRPLAEAARACGKTANVVSQRRAWQPLPNGP